MLGILHLMQNLIFGRCRSGQMWFSKSSIKKVMIGLNVTNKVFFNEDRINKTFIFNNKYDSIVKTMLKGVLGNYHEYGYDGISLHDAMRCSLSY